MKTYTNLYDSHCHFLATGQVKQQLDLRSCRSIADIQQLLTKILAGRPKRIVGFGWDQHYFAGAQLPHHKDLDPVTQNIPTYLSRIDGHAMWLNQAALDLHKNDVAQLSESVKASQVLRDAHGDFQGIFFDQAMTPLLERLQQNSQQEVQEACNMAEGLWKSHGYTRIRDMSCEPLQWELLKKRTDPKALIVDTNITVEREGLFADSLKQALQWRQEQTASLRILGLKVYFDGALGSEGAALSQPYPGSNNDGFILWPKELVKSWFQQIWRAGFEVSVHALGNRASRLLVDVLDDLQAMNYRGPTNLEHGEVIDQAVLQRLAHHQVCIHFQPSHFLSDQKWLKSKLPNLFERCFPWAEAEELGIPFFFGSDSPIEDPNPENTLLGVQKAEASGLRRPKKTALEYHQFRNWY